MYLVRKSDWADTRLSADWRSIILKHIWLWELTGKRLTILLPVQCQLISHFFLSKGLNNCHKIVNFYWKRKRNVYIAVLLHNTYIKNSCGCTRTGLYDFLFVPELFWIYLNKWDEENIHNSSAIQLGNDKNVNIINVFITICIFYGFIVIQIIDGDVFAECGCQMKKKKRNQKLLQILWYLVWLHWAWFAR